MLKGEIADDPLVKHVRDDGLKWRPRRPVDWLVCDIADQPRRIATLVASWIGDGTARRAIFNLKLPMKKRWDETRLCLDLFEQQAKKPLLIRARQLYHDREEITVFASVR
jgi:23S rRNA (cytidine2498-2'-O)-methyltransferase